MITQSYTDFVRTLWYTSLRKSFRSALCTLLVRGTTTYKGYWPAKWGGRWLAMVQVLVLEFDEATRGCLHEILATQGHYDMVEVQRRRTHWSTSVPTKRAWS